MPFFTNEQRKELIDNSEKLEGRHLWMIELSEPTDIHTGMKPVVKLVAPDSGEHWLLLAINPSNEDQAYGLHHISNDTPNITFVRLSKLEEEGYKPDTNFKGDKGLEAYKTEMLVILQSSSRLAELLWDNAPLPERSLEKHESFERPDDYDR